jgi:heme oxygenase
MGIEAPFTDAAAAKNISLSEAFRERTASVHLTAERSGIINDILKQKAGQDGYALLLRNILPAYEKLEAGLRDRAQNNVLSAFAQPALYRAPAIRNDLVQLVGKDFESALPLLDAGAKYVERIASAAEGDGMRLISHAYVRYLGDLSGGQVLKKMLGKSMSLPAQALTLYDFPQIADHGAYKDQLRAAIDKAAEVVSDPEELISEAVAAFEHNIAISNAVQDKMGSASQ